MFLKLFCLEDGKGLLAFAVHMYRTGDLMKLIKYLFRPPNRYPIYNTKDDNDSGKIDDGYEESVDYTQTGEIVLGFVADIQSLELGEETEHVSIYVFYKD